MSGKFLTCPFCGDIPMLSPVEERDDRRYMVMELECCVTMKSAIGYGKFKSMTERAIKEELLSRLTEKWNRRAKPEHDPGDLLNETAVESAKQAFLYTWEDHHGEEPRGPIADSLDTLLPPAIKAYFDGLPLEKV